MAAEPEINPKLVERDGLRVHAATQASLNDEVKTLTGGQIRVAAAKVGPVTEEDVLECLATHKYEWQFTFILAFGVTVTADAKAASKEHDIPIIECESAWPAMKEIRGKIKALRKKKDSDWVCYKQLLGGEIAMFHRPTPKQVAQLAAEGCTHIISLFSPREKPGDIRRACIENGVKHIFVHMEGAHILRMKKDRARIIRALWAIQDLLAGVGEPALVGNDIPPPPPKTDDDGGDAGEGDSADKPATTITTAELVASQRDLAEIPEHLIDDVGAIESALDHALAEGGVEEEGESGGEEGGADSSEHTPVWESHGEPAPRIVFHCAAGIHRTGTFTYSLMRLCGLGPEEARESLYEIRPVTGRQVGEQRVEAAEELIEIAATFAHKRPARLHPSQSEAARNQAFWVGGAAAE